jgi:hypothetical protein
MYLGFLLGFVEDLIPLCLVTLNKFIWSGKFLGKLKVSTTKFVYLQYKVWVLVLHGFSLLVCLQPLGHDNPHKENIQNELILSKVYRKSLVFVLLMYLSLVNCVFLSCCVDALYTQC